MKPIREHLEHAPMLFDGAMGTYYRSLYPHRDPRCELANLQKPGDILEIHRAYLQAGAQAIKTNTFGANPVALEMRFDEVREILWAGYRLACEAAGDNAYVFADIGPIAQPETKAAAEYCRIAAEFLNMGARNFLFETFPSGEGLEEVCRFIHAQQPDAFILVSFAATPDGFTRQGVPVAKLVRRAATYADATGLNCVSGPAHLLRLSLGMHLPVFQSLMPNSGYPTTIGGRTFFESSPSYFAEQMAQAPAHGIRILGGCCGTTPEHIARTAQALQNTGITQHPPAVKEAAPISRKEPAPNALLQKMEQGKKIITVEIDPPVDADGSFFMEAASRMKHAGVDAVTIADCPVARVRADSCMLAAKLHRELGIDVIPHMTCRDRNLNASKALLLGLAMEGVDNVLVVTGDPLPNASRDEVKAVFSFHSAMLAGYIQALGEEVLPKPFLIAAALNVNAPNFDAELKKALRKKENGVQLFMTQPVYTDQAIENLRRAKEATGLRILGGLLPPVSYRNACYMHNEISGIRLSDELLSQYKDTSPEEAARISIQLCLKIAKKIAPFVDGYYLMTPFKRIDLIEELVKEIPRQLL